MIPAAMPIGNSMSIGQQTSMNSTDRTSQPLQPETARSSAGEASAANIRAQSAKAVAAPEQAAITARLRNQEDAEHTERDRPAKDAPTGPPPAFKETPLQRQARIALETELQEDVEAVKRDGDDRIADEAPRETQPGAASDATQPAGPAPPTPTQKAETAFAETRGLANEGQPATVDVSR